MSTGFRAPTPGQSNAYNVSTQFDLMLNDLVNNGTIPSSSEVAALRGGKPLVAEKSINYSAGAVLRAGKVHVTTDLFRIDLRDRLAVTQNFALTPEEVRAPARGGHYERGEHPEFPFLHQRLRDHHPGYRRGGHPYTAGATDVHLLFNHTDTEVTDFNPDTLSVSRIQQLEQALPKTRAALSLTRAINKLRLLGRVSTYSGWYDFDDSFSYDGGHVLLDLEAAYTLRKHITLVAGGQNVFNHYPDETPAPAPGWATSTASTRRSGSTARSGTDGSA